MHIQELRELAMSKIDDLIAEYCPDGVERKPLGAIAKLYRGMACKRRILRTKALDASIMVRFIRDTILLRLRPFRS